ncbi:MAG: lysophospholipid acyltransferase family protein [Acidaminobacteraceae bacterium]
MIKVIVKFLMKSFFQLKYRVSLSGLSKLPKDSGYIMCANHINLQDPLVLGIVLPFNIRYMAKKELFENPILARFLTFAGGFPVDRDGNDLGAIKKSLKILKSKEALLIFAEGTRNRTGEPLMAKPGVAMMAIKAKVPVIPVTIDSSYKLFSKVNIVLHDPVTFEEFYGEKLSATEYQSLTQGIVDGIYTDAILYKNSCKNIHA